MQQPADAQFITVETAAQSGCYGMNSLPEPTEAQKKSGNYKMGRFTLHGMPIAIEQPRNSYRTGKGENGKRWSSRMAAHYGYFSGTKGADGDAVDVFVGYYPQAEKAYIINQEWSGRFDEHKVMLAFPDEESARRAYLNSYEKGWKGLGSIVECSVSQLKWWLKNADKSRPVFTQNLPYEGIEEMKKIAWGENALPVGTSLDRVLYDVRRNDSEGLLMDGVTVAEIMEDAEETMALDALVVPFVRLDRQMGILRNVMERAAGTVKPVSVQTTEPFKQRGTANVAAVFEMSDGQTVSVFFHNPDVTPNKIAPSDDLVSWKWLLNKKDITIVVAPERGVDLNVREVARRIMALAEKNSAAFQRANARRAERMGAIQTLKDEISGLEKELSQAQAELEAARIEAEDRAAKPSVAEQVEEATPQGGAGWEGYSVRYENGDPKAFGPDGNESAEYEGFAKSAMGDKVVTYLKDGKREWKDVLLLSEAVRNDEPAALREARDLDAADHDLLERFKASQNKSGVAYEISSIGGNAATIKPAAFGGTFSQEDIDGLKGWLDEYGFSVIKTTDAGGVLQIVARDREFANAFAVHSANASPAGGGDNSQGPESADGNEASIPDHLRPFSRYTDKGLRMPTAAQLMVKGLGRLVTYKGNGGWTNGQMLDLAGIPPVVKAALQDNPGEVQEARVASVVRSAEGGVQVRPETAYYSAPEKGARNTKGERIQPTDNIILVSGDRSVAVAVQRKYLAYFEKVHKSPDYFATGPRDAVMVRKNGEEVGVFMPISMESDSGSLAKLSAEGADAADAMERQAQEEQQAKENEPIERVDAAYEFRLASDSFKIWLSRSVDDDQYSPFVTAKLLDQRAQERGVIISWNKHEARLDDVNDLTVGQDPDGTGDQADEQDGVEQQALALFDDVEFDAAANEPSYVGRVLMAGQLIGRVDISDDGKAIVYKGETGAERVASADGQQASRTNDAAHMIDWLVDGLKASLAQGDENIGREWNSIQGKKKVVERQLGTTGEDEYVVVGIDTGARYIYRVSQLEDAIKSEEYRLTDDYAKDQEALAEAQRLREEALAKQKEESDRIDAEIAAFTANMTQVAAGKARAALLASVRSGGEVVSRKGLVEARIERGYSVSGDAGDRWLVNAEGAGLSEKQITKTAMDYAEFLIARKQSESTPDAGQSEAVQEDAGSGDEASGNPYQVGDNAHNSGLNQTGTVTKVDGDNIHVLTSGGSAVWPHAETTKIDDENSDDGAEMAAISQGLQRLIDGEVTDTAEFDQMLDDLADRADRAGAMQELDGQLNAAADKLTEMLEKEAENVA